MFRNEPTPLATVRVVLRILAVAAPLLTMCNVCAKTQASTAASRTMGPDFKVIETSPQIGALKQRLKSGGPRALDQFWRNAERTGTPLIEPDKDNPHEVIVTFLWRADSGVQRIGLLAPLQKSPGMPNFPLTHLPDTDVWYKCWQMRDDLRFTYRFLPNITPGDEYSQQDAKLDPLNPRVIGVSYDDGATTIEFSIAAMPHALDESWITPQSGVTRGKIEQQQLRSVILGKERGVSVYTPAGYNEKAQSDYWLLVLFDGLFYRTSIPTPTILDNLIHAGKIPPIVAVLIDNPREVRMADLGYNRPFVDFLIEEMLPWVHRHWKVTRDPRKCIVGGFSMGGSEAAYVALKHPEAFGKVLSQSGAFADGHGADVKWEWLSSQYRASPKLSLRFFIEEGRLENVSKDGPSGLAANRDFEEILKVKGYPTTYEEIGGSHEPVHWRGALAEGLISLTK